MIRHLINVYKRNSLLFVYYIILFIGLLSYFCLKPFYTDDSIFNIFVELIIPLLLVLFVLYSTIYKDKNFIFIISIISIASFISFTNMPQNNIGPSAFIIALLPILLFITLFRYLKNKQTALYTTTIFILLFLYLIIWFLFVPYQWILN